MKLEHFSTLQEYCEGINIAAPKWNTFDMRSFEENMKTVHPKMLPFKHEFYAIALKLDGDGYAKTGNFSTENLKVTVFFNSPYQIQQWNIAPNWKGFYIIFTEDFYRNGLSNNISTKRITEDFPYLLNDSTIPMPLTSEETELISKLFSDIHFEFNLEKQDSSQIIAHYLQILLHKVGRLFKRTTPNTNPTQSQRALDLNVVSRFKSLLELSFHPGREYNGLHPHQVQFYAEKLNLHPNHFNAIIKRITETTPSEHIYNHILSLGKSKLTNTSKSVKEIAFDLYYSYPNHFTNFFKSHTQLTPSQYRKSL